MFNPQKVIDLINECGITRKALLEYMGKNWNGSVDAVLKGDIRVSKLEKIADFFGVPVDTFFDRDTVSPGVRVIGIRSTGLKSSVNENDRAIKVLQDLIDEKDKRIATLEELLTVYKSQHEKNE